MSDDLWEKARQLFKAHVHQRVDRDAQAALNRIAAECAGIAFDETNSTIRPEIIAIEELWQMGRLHNRAVPSRGFEESEPVVVLEVAGRKFVIDGTSRINRWHAIGDSRPRSAIIITRTNNNLI